MNTCSTKLTRKFLMEKGFTGLIVTSSKLQLAMALYACYLSMCMNLQEDPEPTKAKLEKFLESRGIPYKYGTKTKFANFRHRTLE